MCLHPGALQGPRHKGRGPCRSSGESMIRSFGLVLLTLPVAAVALSGASAQAQSYPPYYRSAPPPGPYYNDRLPPPNYFDDEDDDAPVVRNPRVPRYSQQLPPAVQRGQGGAPTRVLPYPEEADAAPPPPGFVTQSGQPPAYGHQLDQQPPRQLTPAQNDPDVLRPPGAIGNNPPPAQQATPQQGASQPGAPAASVMTLPPEDQPEVGQPKELPANLKKQLVDFVTKEPAGTLIVDTPNTYLYLVLGNGKALRYGIGVGREGFTWT